jgi:hypothetical protein
MGGKPKITYAKEPEIWPAKVDVKDIMKKASRSLGFLSDLRLLPARDCKGVTRIKRPTT